MIKWKAGVNSGDEFDFAEEPKKVGLEKTWSICLTKDEKYLLVGSYSLVSVFETKTREVIEEFYLIDYVQAITLIKNGKTAIVAEYDGDLSKIDLKTLEISSIAKNIIKN